MMKDVDAEGDMRRLFGIIDSMTADERRNPSKVVDQSRRVAWRLAPESIPRSQCAGQAV